MLIVLICMRETGYVETRHALSLHILGGIDLFGVWFRNPEIIESFTDVYTNLLISQHLEDSQKIKDQAQPRRKFLQQLSE